MKSRAYAVALAAISAALAVVFVVIQAYVPVMTIAFNVMAAMAVNLPLTKNMWKSGILAYVAAAGLGFLFVNIKALPFIMLFGVYSVLSYALDFKFFAIEKLPKWLKILIITVIKIGFYFLMFWACYKLMGVALDTVNIFGKDFSLNFYILWGIGFSAFCIYDPLMRWVFKCERNLINRIVKH